MLKDKLRDSPLPQRTGCSHCPDPALLLHQLTVYQCHQFSLHGPAKHALGCIAKAHPCEKVEKWKKLHCYNW